MKENIDMKKNNKVSSLQRKKRASSASYMMIMTVLVVFVVIVVNIIVASLTPEVRQFDLSKNNIFTLTDTTLDFLDTLEDEVTIYTVAEAGNTNNDFERLLSVYAAKSDKIKLETINPAQNPQFLVDRDIAISQGSIVIECNGKSKGVELTEMIIKKDDEETGNTYYLYDMEGQITSTINYLVNDNEKNAYVITGSGRDVLDDTLVKEIEKQNIDMKKVNLIEEGEIPEDADIIIIDQPAVDLTEKEFDLIVDFMDNGGSLLVFEYYKNYSDTEMPFFAELLEKYGMAVNNGVVIEQKDKYLFDSDTPYYSKPIILESDITDPLIEDDVTLIVATADKIELIDKPDSVTLTPLLTSSSSAYYKEKYAKSSMAKLSTDPIGTFNYAVAATDDISDDLQSKMIMISSFSFAETDLFQDQIGDGNTMFVVNSMKWLADQESTISIPVKMKTYSNLIYSLADKKKIMVSVVIIIPAVVLCYGGYVWFRRRKR